MASKGKKPLGPQDVTRRMEELAFGRVNDCVKLALLDDCDIDGLDLSLLAEIKRGAGGAVEVKLINRMQALELLAARVGGQHGEAESFLRALQGGSDGGG